MMGETIFKKTLILFPFLNINENHIEKLLIL